MMTPNQAIVVEQTQSKNRVENGQTQIAQSKERGELCGKNQRRSEDECLEIQQWTYFKQALFRTILFVNANADKWQVTSYKQN